MLQALLVVAPSSNHYTVSTMLFHKYVGANFSVTNCMSHFTMLVSTKDTVKMDNVNTGHSQGVCIILCHFTNCPIIDTVRPVYFFQVSLQTLSYWVPSNIFWLSESLDHCDFFGPQGHSWRSTYQTRNNLECLQIKIVNVNPKKTGLLLSQLSMLYQYIIYLRLFIITLFMSILLV